MTKVVVLNSALIDYDHQLDWTALGPDAVLYEATAPDEILTRIADATVVVAKEMPMDATLIEQFPDSVKMVVEAGTGYNNWDLAALKTKGIRLTNIPSYSTDRVAHTAILLMLSLASSMQTQLKMLAEGDHRNFSDHLMVNHVELNGKTLGIMGYGHIGQKVTAIARAMDMKVLVSTRTPRPDEPGVHFTSREELLEKSDFVSLHMALNDETEHVINKDTLAIMKPTAFLINTARGGLVDEPALIEALMSRQIAGAGLDVQAVEPLPDDSPLFTLDNVIVTPHMGWKGLETRQRLVNMINDNIEAFLRGELINLITLTGQ